MTGGAPTSRTPTNTENQRIQVASASLPAEQRSHLPNVQETVIQLHKCEYKAVDGGPTMQGKV